MFNQRSFFYLQLDSMELNAKDQELKEQFGKAVLVEFARLDLEAKRRRQRKRLTRYHTKASIGGAEKNVLAKVWRFLVLATIIDHNLISLKFCRVCCTEDGIQGWLP